MAEINNYGFLGRYWKTGLIILAWWTFLAILFAPQTYLANLSSPTPLNLWQVLSANFILFYVWALLTPFVLWLSGRFPLERPRLSRNFIVQLISNLLFAVTHILLVLIFNNLLLPWGNSYKLPIPVSVYFASMGATSMMICSGIIVAGQAINYFRKYRERNFQLAQAELQMLKMQLHPHFLFNTINAISELVYEEPEIADQTLSQLSDLLRLSLQGGKAQEVSLREELNFLEKYIEIQQMLLQSRLKVNYDIAPETLDAKVPNMILQPLAENAIRHGIAPSVAGGTLEIKAARENKMLRLSVKDDGLGFAAHTEIVKSDGIGLANTRARLRQLYPNAYQFEIKNPEGGGVEISLAVPFEEIEAIDEN